MSKLPITTDEIEKRLSALEEHSHVPFDFTELIERIEALEAATPANSRTEAIGVREAAIRECAEVANTFKCSICGLDGEIGASINTLLKWPQAEITDAIVERAARAMVTAWCYAPEDTPDWNANWAANQTQYRKQAHAALRALLQKEGK